MYRTWGSLFALASVVVVAGCPSEPSVPPTPDGGGADAPGIDASGLDAPRPDGGGVCTSDAECGDGLFCNGAEVCGVSGCTSGAAPCAASCDEATDTCSGCADPDVDRDGFD